MFYNLDVLVPLFPDQNTFCRKTILPCSFIVKTHFVIEWPGLKLKQMKKKILEMQLPILDVKDSGMLSNVVII